MNRINIELNTPPEVMPYGVHKGKLIEEVPSDYLGWIMGEDIDSSLSKEISLEYESRTIADNHFYSEGYNPDTGEKELLEEVKI